MNENIITIRSRNLIEGQKAFADLMIKAEQYLNHQAKLDSQMFKSCEAKDIENLSLKALKEVSATTPFRKEEIKLVSAQYFPDIIAERYYGVEVKSTKSNHWTSTGSSIVESTRDKYVENIYLLFGKLGGEPVEFRCKPYEECMCDIAVTHSPRYLINMEIDKTQTIFHKIGMSYDDLRNSPQSIEKVRAYYRKKAELNNKKEMPWWLAANNSETSTNINLRLWADIDLESKKKLKAQIFILFPDVFRRNYKDTALWLCTRHSILNLNVRDLFSASGQYKYLNGEKLPLPIPHIVGELLSVMPLIKYYLQDKDFENEILEFHPMYRDGDKYSLWKREIMPLVDNIVTNGYKIKNLKWLELEKWIDNPLENVLTIR